MVRTNWGGNGELLEVNLGKVDIPRARDLADLLEEWYSWYNKYGSLIGEHHTLIDIYLRSEEALKKWGRVEDV